LKKLIFFAFCGKTIVPKVYITTPINVMCSISRNLADGKSAVVHYLPDKKKQNFVWLSSSRCCMDCAQNLSGTAVDNVLRVLQISSNRFTFGGVILECVNTIKMVVKCFQYLAEA